MTFWTSAAEQDRHVLMCPAQGSEELPAAQLREEEVRHDHGDDAVVAATQPERVEPVAAFGRHFSTPPPVPSSSHDRGPAVPSASRPAVEGGRLIAHPWGVLPRDWAGGLALTHNGSNLRWYATVWLAPERDLAMLAVTNVGGDLAFVGVDEAVLAMISRFEAADGS